MCATIIELLRTRCDFFVFSPPTHSLVDEYDVKFRDRFIPQFAAQLINQKSISTGNDKGMCRKRGLNVFPSIVHLLAFFPSLFELESNRITNNGAAF